MKTLILFSLLGFASSTFAGEIPGGTYLLKGVATTLWTDWNCTATGWKKVKQGRTLIEQNRNYVVRDMGWALTSAETGLLKAAQDSQSSCTYLHAGSNYKYRTSSSLVPFDRNHPTPCLDANGRIITITISHNDREPFASCRAGEKRRSREFKFQHGYELDQTQNLVWNPQAVELLAQ